MVRGGRGGEKGKGHKRKRTGGRQLSPRQTGPGSRNPGGPEESYASVAAVACSRGEWRPEWEEPRQGPEVQTSQKGLLPRNGETWGKKEVKVKVGRVANCLAASHLWRKPGGGVGRCSPISALRRTCLVNVWVNSDSNTCFTYLFITYF